MAKNNEHPNWGGKREGSGRKKLIDPLQRDMDSRSLSITLRISAKTKEMTDKLKPILKEDGTSLGLLFEKVVKDTADFYGLE